MEPKDRPNGHEDLIGIGEDEEPEGGQIVPPPAPEGGQIVPPPVPQRGLADEEEVEQGRVPRTRKCPVGMSVEELWVHSLTHIPYHPGCKCCVAGRKRDHIHPLRDS